MKILQVSPNHHVVGGSDRVFIETTALLLKSGHQVVPFCVQSAENLPSDYASYFPSAANTDAPSARDTVRYFYNADARHHAAQLVQDDGPFDIAHLHIYHGKLTPSILPVFSRAGVGVVHSLHEYKLACPVYTMQRGDKPCDLCVSGSALNAVRHRCKDGSLLRSAVMVAESLTSRLLGDVRLVDRFICVSAFQRGVMQRAGIPAEKLVTLHNFVDTTRITPELGHDGYLLYFGRVEALKGIFTLVNAVVASGQKLIVAGTGAGVDELLRRIVGVANIEYVGFQAGANLRRLIGRSRAVVVPSEWYENCPMTVLEAKAAGRPVIGADIGGIPELVRDGIDGFLFEPGNALALSQTLQRMERADFGQLSAAARADAVSRFSAQAHLSGLIRVYSDAKRCHADTSSQTPSASTADGRVS